MVGRALKQVPDNVSTPCHRVVNASGRLVPGWEEQKQILLEEGVSFKQNGCVDLKKFVLFSTVAPTILTNDKQVESSLGSATLHDSMATL